MDNPWLGHLVMLHTIISSGPLIGQPCLMLSADWLMRQLGGTLIHEGESIKILGGQS